MLQAEQYKHKYPEFMKIVDLISMQNPLQKKRINNFISRQDTNYWIYAEEICRKLNQSFLRSGQERIETARSYNRMSMDFLREQIRFSKTGVYSVDDASLARQNVYDRPEIMRYYMIGLLLSYLLWPNHFAILRFFKIYLQQMSTIKHYLDIAPGHGLFAVEAMQRFPNPRATLLDISRTSVQITTDVLAAFQVDSSRFHFINDDFMTVPLEGNSFDFISMGEVLEHVNDPSGFLERARCLLQPQGIIFMSTCANCPAIDHVYHFRHEDEIRSMIHDVDLSIAKESVLPVEAVPQEEYHNKFVPINYCAILTKGKNKVV